jgi:hypothetical protein
MNSRSSDGEWRGSVKRVCEEGCEEGCEGVCEEGCEEGCVRVLVKEGGRRTSVLKVDAQPLAQIGAELVEGGEAGELVEALVVPVKWAAGEGAGVNLGGRAVGGVEWLAGGRQTLRVGAWRWSLVYLVGCGIVLARWAGDFTPGRARGEVGEDREEEEATTERGHEVEGVLDPTNGRHKATRDEHDLGGEGGDGLGLEVRARPLETSMIWEAREGTGEVVGGKGLGEGEDEQEGSEEGR